MKQLFVLISVLLSSLYSFSQIPLYDQGGIRMSYTTTVSKTVFCSKENKNVYFVKAKWEVYNYSGKSIYLSLAINMTTNANGMTCIVEDNVSNYYYQGSGVGTYNGEFKTGDKIYGEDGSWYFGTDVTPWWTISVKPLWQGPKKTLPNSKNTSTKTQTKPVYGISQQDDVINNPKPQVDYAKKQEEEDKVVADRNKAAQEQERQKQQQLKKQNDEATKYKQDQIEKQQERQRQTTAREDALKKKVESDKLANDNLSKTLNNSIEDAFNIIKANLDKSQKEEENNTQPIENKDPSNLSAAELFEKGNYAQYTEKNMSSAIYWYTNSANSGYSKAMIKLADYYTMEETANYDLAIDWWLLAYRNKNIDLGVLDKITAAYGNTYQPKNYSNIFQFYKIILHDEVIYQHLKYQGDDMWATYNLANFYYTGNGGQQIFTEAFSLHKKNADNGFVPSMIVLGILYRDGAGTTKDYNEAIKWWSNVVEIAGTRVSNWAMFLLGEMYEKGLGVEKNLGKAKEWYIKSSNAGFQGAKTKLENWSN